MLGPGNRHPISRRLSSCSLTLFSPENISFYMIIYLLILTLGHPIFVNGETHTVMLCRKLTSIFKEI